ncbi:hypothetical protein EMIHUDRAFT_120076 [Emiliania huxleyi CCMP1516]|uniref:Post-SET domain-containing protein n=2 Tax=Emiliania huxleyi TaxID=2903 RepID=A0A0D3IMS8_EMIH1|nr:hypothetical protein EMIHUDRAFT_120076 [Emiliania huxleyi CCMP1516]EOD12563.1 hypothetical protein EMIHUDRAFT_120076 [Emiliania huxleyi CCMP1516]|eukprot:XP_005764992.1 hypothetical protein EMIHUDRAFT_120076 [Emiliania huxleyi CCMP1516]
MSQGERATKRVADQQRRRREQRESKESQPASITFDAAVAKVASEAALGVAEVEDFRDWLLDPQQAGQPIDGERITEWRASEAYERARLECMDGCMCEGACTCTYAGVGIAPDVPGVTCDYLDEALLEPRANDGQPRQERALELQGRISLFYGRPWDEERARWFRDHGGGGELEGSTRKQNEAFQRLKDRLFSLPRDRANPSGTPRASQRRASGAGSSTDPLRLSTECTLERSAYCSGITDGIPLCACLCRHLSATYTRSCVGTLAMFMQTWHHEAGNIADRGLGPPPTAWALGVALVSSVFLTGAISVVYWYARATAAASSRAVSTTPRREIAFYEADAPSDGAAITDDVGSVGFMVAMNPGEHNPAIAVPVKKSGEAGATLL